MNVETIDTLDDERVADYRNVPDPVLLKQRGLFVAEGRIVVRHLLAGHHYAVRSVLVSPPALESLRDLADLRPGIPLYVAPADVLSGIVGFNMHRGCLAICQRPAGATVAATLAQAASARLIVVAEHIGNADNMGGLFRSAMAFGAGAVLLSPDCCDPLYRKAVRVSIGGTVRVPSAVIEDWPNGLLTLKQAGYTLVGLTPDARAKELGEWAFQERRPARIALVVGHEGSGLSDPALTMIDSRVRIEMVAGVDSLNVATAAGIAMYACSGLWRPA
ncbi:MAG: RNA methyltransferase [Acidobacteriota bacterium]